MNSEEDEDIPRCSNGECLYGLVDEIRVGLQPTVGNVKKIPSARIIWGAYNPNTFANNIPKALNIQNWFLLQKPAKTTSYNLKLVTIFSFVITK